MLACESNGRASWGSPVGKGERTLGEMFGLMSSVVAHAYLAAAPAAYGPQPADADVSSTDTVEEEEPRWSSEGFYSAMGVAPTMTVYPIGFNAGLRYDLEIGMHWRRRRTTLFVGADAKVLQSFGRKRPGGGVDAVFTASRGALYGRVGLGAMTGIPNSPDVNRYAPAVGGLVGFGLQGRHGDVVGRLGVDYDVRLDNTGRVNQTVMLSLRIVFGFEEW